MRDAARGNRRPGEVVSRTPVAAVEAARRVGWPALWPGRRVGRLALRSVELERLARGYPPAVRRPVERGEGVRLVYRAPEPASAEVVEIAQAPRPEAAYAYWGASTFALGPVPAAGRVAVTRVPAGGRTTWIGQLTAGPVYVTIWASSRALCLRAARSLRPLRGRP